jgi:hypothetical protein
MKNSMSLVRCIAAYPRLIFGTLAVLAMHAPSNATAQERSAVERELEIVATIRQAVGRNDESTVERQLSLPSPIADKRAQSAVLARRAVHACGWLRNDNEHGRAQALAQRVIALLARMTEVETADRAERLYWEAWLEAEILGNRKRAIELALEAEKLAPDDERIAEDAYRWASAVAEFGS